MASAAADAGARFVALDQLRGLTVSAMLVVNLGNVGMGPFFSHGRTYTSGPDLVQPAFLFCVGFALRLVALKRVSAARRAGASWLTARRNLFTSVLRTRGGIDRPRSLLRGLGLV